MGQPLQAGPVRGVDKDLETGKRVGRPWFYVLLYFLSSFFLNNADCGCEGSDLAGEIYNVW